MKRAEEIRGPHGNICVCCSCEVTNRPMPWKTTPSRHAICPTCDCNETAAFQLQMAYAGQFSPKGIDIMLSDDVIDQDTRDQVIEHMKFNFPEMFDDK